MNTRRISQNPSQFDTPLLQGEKLGRITGKSLHTAVKFPAFPLAVFSAKPCKAFVGNIFRVFRLVTVKTVPDASHEITFFVRFEQVVYKRGATPLPFRKFRKNAIEKAACTGGRIEPVRRDCIGKQGSNVIVIECED